MTAKTHKGTRMKKLLYILLITCLGALKAEEHKPQGWFFGLGLGAGVQTWDRERANKGIEEVNHFLGSISAKIGGYHSFLPFGLRYYYSLDLGRVETTSDHFANVPIYNDWRVQPVARMLSETHLLNADFLFSPYWTQDFRVDLILGLGMGTIKQSYNLVYGGHGAVRDSNRYVVEFHARANLGTKLIFKDRYGIELLAKIPLTPAVKMSSYWKDTATNSENRGVRSIKMQDYSLVLGFVMEL